MADQQRAKTDESAPYTIGDLSRLADVTPRTVRYYVAQGLLPAPAGAGQASRYGEGHLARIRLIRRLQREHLPLAEIRVRLGSLTGAEVAELSAQAPAAPAPGSALDYVRAVLAGAMPGTAAPHAVSTSAAPAPTTKTASVGTSAVKAGAPRRTTEATSPPAPAPNAVRVGGAAAAPLVRAVTEPTSSYRASQGADQQPDDGPIVSQPAMPAVPETDGVGARSQWDRITLTSDIELHIRRPLSRIQNRRVERLIAIARELLEEA